MNFLNQNQEEEREEEPLQQPMQPIWDEKQFLEFVKHYSEDDTIPKETKKSKWAIFSKALLYTFLDEKDLPMIDIWGNILRIDALINQPPHKITFDEVHALDQSQFYMYCTAKRAIGTDRDKMNERSLQNTQIAQTIATHTSARKPSGGGVMSKLRRMF